VQMQSEFSKNVSSMSLGQKVDNEPWNLIFSEQKSGSRKASHR